MPLVFHPLLILFENRIKFCKEPLVFSELILLTFLYLSLRWLARMHGLLIIILINIKCLIVFVINDLLCVFKLILSLGIGLFKIAVILVRCIFTYRRFYIAGYWGLTYIFVSEGALLIVFRFDCEFQIFIFRFSTTIAYLLKCLGLKFLTLDFM